MTVSVGRNHDLLSIQCPIGIVLEQGTLVETGPLYSGPLYSRVMAQIRIAAAQLNLVVGDLDGNAARIVNALERAERDECDLVVFPELAITGYPPEDLVLRPAFVAHGAGVLNKVAARTGNALAIIGFTERTERTDAESPALANSVALCTQGRVVGVYRKQELPNYSVFDEARYFVPGSDDGPLVSLRGIRVAVSICEDIWTTAGPVLRQAAAGADLVVNVNASPYYAGRLALRTEMLVERTTTAGVPVLSVNLVGGQDELVFDGGSMLVDATGTVVARARQFDEDLMIFDVDIPRRAVASSLPEIEISIAPRAASSQKVDKDFVPRIEPPLTLEQEIYSALVLGTRDYVIKNGFTEVLIGLSGGIDSALVAAIATAALGADRVTGVLMPSRFSSAGSIADATALAVNLGINILTVPIEPAHAAFLSMLSESFAGYETGLAEENLQARIRGTILMTMSNKFNKMVLTTGNKSEIAVGYSTLYGDMAGGFAVIKDVSKTMVTALCRNLNVVAGTEVIPNLIIDKPPSAELRPDQLDSDSLPPYDTLDSIIEGYVEGDQSVEELISAGNDPDVVRKVAALIDRNEYKRRQSAPGVRVSPKAFGKDRRLPITNHWPG